MTAEIRQQIVDQMMDRLARLLPQEYHGEYANLVNSTAVYLEDLSV